MNLVDGKRIDSGLFFTSSIYASDHTSTVISSRCIPEVTNLLLAPNIKIKDIIQPVNVFANTIRTVEVDYSPEQFEREWEINNHERMINAGLSLQPKFSSMFEAEFEETLDYFLNRCEQYASDKKVFKRFIAMLMATSYLSPELALKYAKDMTFTEDMLALFTLKIINNNYLFNNEKDYDYLVEASKLPSIYSDKLLDAK